MSNTTLLPFQPDAMSPAQLAAVSYLARYSGHTHQRYAYQLRRWFAWCETNRLDPLVGVQRAHVELYIRHLGETGLRASSINTMMHRVRGFFRFAPIDGLIPADPAVYARLPKVHQDESRTEGLDRLELIRFLQVAQTITVHHGALAYLLGINALRASEAAAVRIEDYRETLRGHRVPASCRQGRQARDHAADRTGPARSGGLPRPTHPWTTRTRTGVGQADRPARLLPDGRPDREGGRHSAPHQPALAAPRRHHQRHRRRSPSPRHPDPRQARRASHNRALRPRPRHLDRHGVHFLTAYVAGT